ncbi:hypothetical protein LB533_20170 [Mesorhizobium sp. BR1-1-13]|uniref:hypothetical protein n=1 Tax=Mesorhizobium sp. BR1-1-13 TaxID=2876656 RepID=UPI001CD0F65A|nr:hypothetical protein [Mesorhizobium sp. BR1-1-13]MBZ9943405.1 hypothetical protein [Mesorhizobium sp. BR1-1-13]
MTLESLARTIAKARHGTDAMWANYMGAARAVVELLRLRGGQDLAVSAAEDVEDITDIRAIWRAAFDALITQSDDSDDIPVSPERP